MTCQECGIYEKGLCYYLKTKVFDLNRAATCTYFIAIRFDGNEPFSPEEHLFFKEQELKSRKLKGPLDP